MKSGLILVSLLLIFISVCAADEIRGKVGSVSVSDNSIIVSGVHISAQNARIENEFDQPINLAAIVAGDYVDVDGAFTGPGQMMAMKVEKEYPKYDEINGRVDKVDPAKRELTISGITIKVPQDAWLEGHNDMRISIEQILPNYYVECDGNWTALLEFTASKVEFD